VIRPAQLVSAAADRVVELPGFASVSLAAHAFGPAFTVQGRAGDNLAIHLAVAEAAPGDVLVVTVDGEAGCAHFGDILALAAQRRGLAGLVIDGAIRDRADIAELGFPVFHRGLSLHKPLKRVPGRRGVPIRIGDAVVARGDLVSADADGVVVVPAAAGAEVVAAAEALGEREAEAVAQIEAGRTTVEIFGLSAS
jgi:4-hydroxy-4-methyl-2-oxoglutarate aldolase